MPCDGDLETRSAGVDHAVGVVELAFFRALADEDGLQAAKHLAVWGLAEREAAPGRTQARAERCGVRAVAGDVADQKRETAVLELHAVVEVAAEVESLLARAVDRRDVHARVRDGHDWQERLLEPADENLDLPVRVLLTLEQQLAGRTLELQLEHEVVRAPRGAQGQGDRDRQSCPAEHEQQD